MLPMEPITGKITETVADVMVSTLFQSMKKGFEMQQKQKYFEKASEGTNKEFLIEDLKILDEVFSEELEHITSYTEKELKNIFDKYYEEYISGENPKFNESESKEELWKRFNLFVKDWLEKYNKSISFGEKRILEISRENQDMLKQLIEGGGNQQLLTKIAENQQKLLSDNKNVPSINIKKTCGVEITGYDSKFVFYPTTFDFEENSNRRFGEDEQTYVISLLLKNIGLNNIEKISIENVQLEYIQEAWDDNPELGYYILPAVNHTKKIEHTINILPNEETFIRFMVTDALDELVENLQIDSETFLECFEYQRLFLTFNIYLHSKESQGYQYFLYLSKRDEENIDNIKGFYDVDYSGFIVLPNL